MQKVNLILDFAITYSTELEEMRKNNDSANTEIGFLRIALDDERNEVAELTKQIEYYKGFSDAVKLICGGGGE